MNNPGDPGWIVYYRINVHQTSKDQVNPPTGRQKIQEDSGHLISDNMPPLSVLSQHRLFTMAISVRSLISGNLRRYSGVPGKPSDSLFSTGGFRLACSDRHGNFDVG